MGVRNNAESLSKAIESVLLQTYAHWELIICDDASTDGSYQIAIDYQRKYPDKIIVLRNETNEYLAASLNRCLKEATGNWIARMDADDENMPDRLEKELRFLTAHPEFDCVGSSRIVFDENGDFGIRIAKEYPTQKDLLHNSPFSHPTILMKKSVYETLNGYTVSKNTVRCEDLDLWFRFFHHGFKGYNLQEPLYRYHQPLKHLKRNSWKAAIGTCKVFLSGYRLSRFPIRYYIFAFKPIASMFVPKRLLYRIHKRKIGRLEDS